MRRAAGPGLLADTIAVLRSDQSRSAETAPINHSGATFTARPAISLAASIGGYGTCKADHAGLISHAV